MNERTKTALNAVVSFVLALLLFWFVLAISNKNSKSWDFTKNQRHTLTEQSRKLVKELKNPVRALVFQGPEADKREVEKLLENYRRENRGMFSYEVIDPIKNPRMSKLYGIMYGGQAVLEVREPGMDKDTPGKRQERVSMLDEQTFTSALLKLSDRAELKLVFLTGHGERGLNDSKPEGLAQLRADLEKEAFKPEELNMAVKPEIPPDAAGLVIMGPRTPLSTAEESVLKKYLETGGRVLFCADQATPDSYVKMLAPYGIDLPADIIVDTVSAQAGQEPVIAIGMEFDPAHAATRDMAEQKMNVLLYLARPVVLMPDKAAGYTLTSLVKTAPAAFALPSKDLLGKARITIESIEGVISKMPPEEQKKIKGQAYTVVAASTRKLESTEKPATPTPTPASGAEKKPPAKEFRLVVVGDSYSFSNMLVQIQSNRDFALNLMSYLVQDENRITIREKEEAAKPLYLSQPQVRNIFVLLVLLAALPFIMGILTAIRRR